MSTAAARRRRPAWPAVVAALGALLLLAGLAFALWLGPSGRVEAAGRVGTPGVVVIGKDVLRASSTPVRVRAHAAEGGDLTSVRMLDNDATAVLDGVRHSVVTGVGFLPRALRIADEGDGPMPTSLNADLALEPPATGGDVDVTIPSGRLAQALVIVPGRVGDNRESAVDLTLTWENAAWFWEALAAASLGAIALAAALRALRRPGRATDTADTWVVEAAPATDEEPRP